MRSDALIKGLKSKLVAGAAAGAIGIAAGAAWGATTGTLNLTGTVGEILNVTVSAAAAASSLDLTADTPSGGTKVADVTAFSNNLGGYTVTVSSTNLTNTSCTDSSKPCFFSATTGENLAFDLLRDATTVTGWATQPASFVTDTNSKSALTGDVYEAKVSFSGASANLAEGTDYTETITFTISKS